MFLGFQPHNLYKCTHDPVSLQTSKTIMSPIHFDHFSSQTVKFFQHIGNTPLEWITAYENQVVGCMHSLQNLHSIALKLILNCFKEQALYFSSSKFAEKLRR